MTLAADIWFHVLGFVSFRTRKRKRTAGMCEAAGLHTFASICTASRRMLALRAVSRPDIITAMMCTYSRLPYWASDSPEVVSTLHTTTACRAFSAGVTTMVHHAAASGDYRTLQCIPVEGRNVTSQALAQAADVDVVSWLIRHCCGGHLPRSKAALAYLLALRPPARRGIAILLSSYVHPRDLGIIRCSTSPQQYVLTHDEDTARVMLDVALGADEPRLLPYIPVLTGALRQHSSRHPTADTVLSKAQRREAYRVWEYLVTSQLVSDTANGRALSMCNVDRLSATAVVYLLSTWESGRPPYGRNGLPDHAAVLRAAERNPDTSVAALIRQSV
jgi:hypothetical protein